MRINDVIERLDRLLENGDIKDYAYHHFVSAPTLPYIAYLEYDSSSVMADNQTIYMDHGIRLELYTEKKDIQLEQKLEQEFKNLPIIKEASIWLETENTYMTVYSVF